MYKSYMAHETRGCALKNAAAVIAQSTALALSPVQWASCAPNFSTVLCLSLEYAPSREPC